MVKEEWIRVVGWFSLVVISALSFVSYCWLGDRKEEHLARENLVLLIVKGFFLEQVVRE